MFKIHVNKSKLLRSLFLVLVVATGFWIGSLVFPKFNAPKSQLVSEYGTIGQAKQITGTIRMWRDTHYDTKVIMIIATESEGMYALYIVGSREELTLVRAALQTGARQATFLRFPEMLNTRRGEVQAENIMLQ